MQQLQKLPHPSLNTTTIIIINNKILVTKILKSMSMVLHLRIETFFQCQREDRMLPIPLTDPKT
jgi:hypothetical protein